MPRLLLLFAGGPSGDTTPPTFSSGEEGDVTHATVVATFSEDVNSALNDYALGVTIKYNAVTQTINSAARQVNNAIVHYVIAAEPDNDDVITFEYSDATGDYADDAGNQMGDIGSTGITNNLGTHAIFDNAMDSAHAVITLHL